MRYERKDSKFFISVEDGEVEQDVLRAIAKASFEASIAIRMGLNHYNPDTVLTDELADMFIDTNGFALDMEYVQGRQVKTFISREDDGSLVLVEEWFRKYRGASIEMMLDRAKELLSGAEPQGHLASYGFLFRGESLDLFVAELGAVRNPGESDWDFRQRIFPYLWKEDKMHAQMVLLGAYITDIQEWEVILLMTLSKDPSDKELSSFARGFSIDPLVHRETLLTAKH